MFFLLLLSNIAVVESTDVMVLGGQPRATLLTNRELTGVKKCRYNHPYSMIQAQCNDLNLSDVPKNLRTDIQILDLSFNRIRKLKNATLDSYTKLAYLYLQDNFILTIEEGSFVNLNRLEVIDLTNNGCLDFPKSIIGLPYLRKLYLTVNMLTDASFEPTPLSEVSNLEFLELSKNQLKKLPSLGILPSLKNLNVSANFITDVTTDDLAPFCSLEILDLSENPIKFNESSCDCEHLNFWIETRGIRTKPPKFVCPSETKTTNSRACPVPATVTDATEAFKFSDKTESLFDSCRNVIRSRAETAKARSTWILVASFLGVSLVLLVLFLFCIHKRNEAKKIRQRLKQQQQLVLNNANTELLKGNTLSE